MQVAARFYGFPRLLLFSSLLFSLEQKSSTVSSADGFLGRRESGQTLFLFHRRSIIQQFQLNDILKNVFLYTEALYLSINIATFI